MSRKAFLVQVELDIQAVTCPGVWLCSNGKVSLQIYMLDSCVQSNSYRPIFPIQCNEQFVFYKTFYNQHRLKELENDLHDEWIYIELVQWQSCEIGYVLASFQTTLDELLYPSTCSGSMAGVDLDLLMEAKKAFPGTIAPKIEISTRTTIEETLCICKKSRSSNVIVNPKLLSSIKSNNARKMTRKVCHSVAYSRHRPQFKNFSLNRPPFRYRKAEDDLILRKPQPLPESLSPSKQSCSKFHQHRSMMDTRKMGRGDCPCMGLVQTCSCGSGHRQNACPACDRHKGMLSSEISSQREISPVRTSLFDPKRPPLSSSCPQNHCLCCRPIAFNANEEKYAVETQSDCYCGNCSAQRTKPSLAEKLHNRLTKALNAIPEKCMCNNNNDDFDYERGGCSCPTLRNQIERCEKPAELYNDLQKFYGNLYRRARSNMSCINECQCK